MNEKQKQLLGELEMLGERGDFWYEDFWVTRSPIGGYTVVSVKRTLTEHFSNAQRVIDFLSKYDKSLDEALYEVKYENHIYYKL